MGSIDALSHTKVSGDLRKCPSLAVSARNICKSYKNGEMVLENFNMQVPTGTIYSLLGASGCGKTTALSLIVGILQPTSGTIEVFGNSPGSAYCGVPGPLVGYMPQGISLYEKLTIHEILLYFGRIYGMSAVAIQMKIESLRGILDLPVNESRISNLSGGQKRRVSLAACLIHEPKLLILDEPTVGVDPLLRERIWEYLHRYVSEQNTTVIITTHYIEETKNSNTIGVMRNGQMLIEESPKALMERYDSPYLEEIVTNLFKKAAEFDAEENSLIAVLSPITTNHVVQTDGSKVIDPDVLKSLPVSKSNYQANKACWKGINYSKTKALIIRNLLDALRNPVYMLLLLFLPALNAVSIYPVLGAPVKDLPMGVVNPESNFSSINCIGDFERCSLFSCAFINRVSESVIKPIFMQSEDQAFESVRRGETWGYIRFPENYTNYLISMYSFGNFADNETLDNSEIAFRMDNSHFIIRHLLIKEIVVSAEEVAIKSLKDCGVEEKGGTLKLSLNFREPLYGEGPNNNSRVSSASLLVLTCALPMVIAASILIIDRKDGTMFRNVVAGVTHMDNLLSLSITLGIKILIQTLASYAVSSLLLDWDIQGSHILVMTLLILTAIYGLSLGFLLALICGEQIEAILCTVGFVMFHTTMTGIMWPAEGIPMNLRFYSNCVPLNWVTDAMRSILIRGWPLCHPKVYPAFILLIAMIILQTVIALRLWRKA